VAQKVGEILGVSIVVDHRLGANGTIGVELTARAPAGGYTLLLAGGGPLTIALALDAGVRYDAQRDFVAIARIARVPLVPAVRSGLPVTTAAQLIGYAMTHPRELTYASTGASAQLALESLTAAEGLDIVYVPYKGAALAVFDVVTGRVRSPIS
jgi:tripartite-type tricarboxylate transporter receptor subunit TctC